MADAKRVVVIPEMTRRDKYERLRQQLENEQSTFTSHWQDLSDYVRPRRARFFLSDRNKGDRRNQKIIDSTATLALRTLTSGMTTGLTSPARPWFRLAVPDPDLNENEEVIFWLYDVTRRMSEVFLRSNFYQMIGTMYSDLGLFSTAALGLWEDDETIIRFSSFPIGSFLLSNDNKGRARVFMRKFSMTARQIREEFVKQPDGTEDWSVTSVRVQDAWRQGKPEEWFDIVHVIQPNTEYREGHLLAKHKAFSDCYYEAGAREGADRDKFLRESGFDEFPILAGRWDLTGEDVYGTSGPGMDALGDIKQLQLGERRALQAVEKSINPPMVAPPSMRTSKLSILPGDVSFVSENQQQTFRPAHSVNFDLEKLELKQAQARQRIQRAFFEDLMLMLTLSDRREMTAREVEEKHEEKLLVLGPVLERLNQDVLDPTIDRTFNIMLRRGLIPDPPQVLQGQKLQVEYISILAQAQKMVGLAGLERFASNVTQIATIQPEMMDVVDTDEMAREMADMSGIPPKLLRSVERVEEIRTGRAKAQQAAQAAQNIRSAGAGIKALSGANLEGNNALTAMRDNAEQQSPE
jgi:hypothetical protein